MTMVFVGRIVDALFIFRYKLPPSVIIGYYTHITTISMCGPRLEGVYGGFIINLKRKENIAECCVAHLFLLVLALGAMSGVRTYRLLFLGRCKLLSTV